MVRRRHLVSVLLVAILGAVVIGYGIAAMTATIQSRSPDTLREEMAPPITQTLDASVASDDPAAESATAESSTPNASSTTPTERPLQQSTDGAQPIWVLGLWIIVLFLLGLSAVVVGHRVSEARAARKEVVSPAHKYLVDRAAQFSEPPSIARMRAPDWKLLVALLVTLVIAGVVGWYTITRLSFVPVPMVQWMPDIPLAVEISQLQGNQSQFMVAR